MLRTLILASLIIFLGCSKSGGGDSSSPSKALFSVWTDKTTGHILDLSQGYFGTGTMFFEFATGAKCQCVLTISGTETTGNYSLASCGWVSGTGTGDPGCSGVNQSGGFSNTNAALQICNIAGCTYYN